MNKNCDNLTHKNFLFGRIIIFVTHMKTKNSPAVFSGTNLFEQERIFKTRPLGGIIVDESSKMMKVLKPQYYLEKFQQYIPATLQDLPN